MNLMKTRNATFSFFRLIFYEFYEDKECNFLFIRFFDEFDEDKECSGCQQLFCLRRQQGRRGDLSQVGRQNSPTQMWSSYIYPNSRDFRINVVVKFKSKFQRIQLRRRTCSSQGSRLLLWLELCSLSGWKSYTCKRVSSSLLNISRNWHKSTWMQIYDDGLI